ncbi:MAG: hypothetical protein R3193_07175 [Marinobacter sp.]|nr:hypothetical protein [Marinobacter sp.]
MAKYSDDFTNGATPGGFPSGWTADITNNASADWQVVDDVSALGGKVLRYNAAGSATPNTRTATLDAAGVAVADFDMLCRIKPLTTLQNVSLLGRWVDNDNWYYGGMDNESTNTIRSRARNSGTTTAATAAITPLVAGDWYYFRVKVTGDVIQSAAWPVADSFPGFQVSHTSPVSIASGKVGLTGYYTAQSDIDWVSIGTGVDTADNLDNPTVTPQTRKSSTFDIETTLGTITTATLNSVNVFDHVTGQVGTTVSFAGAATDEITTSGEYDLVLGDGVGTETITVQVNVYGVAPSNNPLQKDGSALASLTGVQIRVTDGANINGTELYYSGTATTDASGNLGNIDLSATAAADTDPVLLHMRTSAGDSIIASETVGLI